MPIEVKDLDFSYPAGPTVLTGVRLRIEDGESVALTGPSGSGKSTLLQLIGGLLRPTRGSVTLSYPARDIRWVFQAPTSLGRRSAVDNVALGLLLSRTARAGMLEDAHTALATVGLAEHAHQRASTLSGGQLQRVQIARALVGGPPLVLGDEPTAQLDHHSTDVVLQALHDAQTPTTSIILATHDHEVARRCDRIIQLQDGVVVERQAGDHP